MQQETMDIVGWGYILWCRLEQLKVKAAKMRADLQTMGEF